MDPYIFRDMQRGVYRPSAVNSFVVPQNSVSNAVNVNFDTIIGSGVVRNGTVRLGTDVATGLSPLGLSNFVGPGGAPNVLVSVFFNSGNNDSKIYYYDGVWHPSNKTTWGIGKTRFATLGGRHFATEQTMGMISTADGATWSTTDCISSADAKPDVILATNARLIAAGDGTFRDRVFFSSIVDPTSSPFITWTPATDWIDVNPDDGGYITGFASTSATTLVFKNNAMYRLDSINATTDPNLIFNVGAVSQEAITTCQGIVYFFSGLDIRRTNGGFPEQISRLGVQEFIDAISADQWSLVGAGTDTFNVYFSIGTVTLQSKRDTQTTYTNVVLKFSPRDETWSVHSYASRYEFYTNYLTSASYLTVGATTSGNVQKINSGFTDNGSAIFYELETQEVEFGNRAHLNQVSDKLAVFTNFGQDSAFYYRADDTDSDYQPLISDLTDRVNIIPINSEAYFMNFKWSGVTSTSTPIFEGFQIESITDLGITEK